MRGALPKDPALRQRRNKSATRAVFVDAPTGIRAPQLPKHITWHDMTRRWWRQVWASPMAAEYLKVDQNALLMLAVMINRFWNEPSTRLATEIRMMQQAFGMTPLDRRRLEWSIIQAEDAKDKHHSRRSHDALPIHSNGGEDDPRHVLTLE